MDLEEDLPTRTTVIGMLGLVGAGTLIHATVPSSEGA